MAQKMITKWGQVEGFVQYREVDRIWPHICWHGLIKITTTGLATEHRPFLSASYPVLLPAGSVSTSFKVQSRVPAWQWSSAVLC